MVGRGVVSSNWGVVGRGITSGTYTKLPGTRVVLTRQFFSCNCCAEMPIRAAMVSNRSPLCTVYCTHPSGGGQRPEVGMAVTVAVVCVLTGCGLAVDVCTSAVGG